jgi:hypothetical protein
MTRFQLELDTARALVLEAGRVVHASYNQLTDRCAVGDHH